MKNKIVAGLLGIFIGSFGIHKFYLGRISWGVIYILLSWTFIPGIVGLIEGIIYLIMSEEAFDAKYNNGTSADSTTKTCPHCAEQVQVAAIKCKHCGSDLSIREA